MSILIKKIITLRNMNFVINNKYLIATILLISCASFAQNSFDAQFNIAKALYSDENYFYTVTELKRLLFFDDNSECNYEANLLIGKSYKQGARFSDAIRYLTLAEINAKTVVVINATITSPVSPTYILPLPGIIADIIPANVPSL